MQKLIWSVYQSRCWHKKNNVWFKHFNSDLIFSLMGSIAQSSIIKRSNYKLYTVNKIYFNLVKVPCRSIGYKDSNFSSIPYCSYSNYKSYNFRTPFLPGLVIGLTIPISASLSKPISSRFHKNYYNMGIYYRGGSYFCSTSWG